MSEETEEEKKKKKKWHEKKTRSGKSLIKDKKSPLDTNAARFTNWMKEKHGDKIRVSSGDRENGKNHSKKNAFDLVGITSLPKKDQDEAFKMALDMDLRVGEETKGKKGVGGWTGSHHHFDGSKGPSFTRGKDTGKANRKGRNKEENKHNDEFVSRMEKLKNTPVNKEDIQGPMPQEVQGPPEPKKDAFKSAREAMEKAAAKPVPFAGAKSLIDEAAARPVPTAQTQDIIEEDEEEIVTSNKEIGMTNDELDDEKKGQQFIADTKNGVNEQAVRLASEGDVLDNAGVHVKDNIHRKVGNQDNIDRGAAESQQSKIDKKQPGVDNQFFEVLKFMGPAIIGGIIGNHIGGDAGAASGINLGMAGAKDFRNAQLAREKFEHSKTGGSGKLAQEKLEISRSNLALREEELEDKKGRSADLNTERADRRKERFATRGNKLKDSYMNRSDIKQNRGQMEGLIALQEIVRIGKKIPSASLALVAKGLSGEKGVLTDKDIGRAQINPDVWNKMKRGYYVNFKGEISPQDAKDIAAIAKLKKAALVKRSRGKTKAFAKSRAKSLDPESAAALEMDLLNEQGLDELEEEKVKSKGGSLSERLNKMSPEDREAFEEYKRNRRSK